MKTNGIPVMLLLTPTEKAAALRLSPHFTRVAARHASGPAPMGVAVEKWMYNAEHLGIEWTAPYPRR